MDIDFWLWFGCQFAIRAFLWIRDRASFHVSVSIDRKTSPNSSYNSILWFKDAFTYHFRANI